MTGAWLGVDIGSRRAKVVDLCLIESVDQQITVRFERGAARDPYPRRNDVVTMLDAEHGGLSSEVLRGLGDLLDTSDLVRRWRTAVRAVNSVAVAAIDGPPGFADPGHRTRATETGAWASFRTPNRADFDADLKRFASASNETPLRQKMYWKLVGIETYRYLAKAAGLADDARALSAHTVAPGRVRLRETFPSDVYQRADGELGRLADRPRALLATLTDASWHQGNVRTITWRGLLTHRRDVLQRALANQKPLVAMSKRDAAGAKVTAAWGDLFDAFACAYVACCEDHGCARLIGNAEHPERTAREGAILTVDTR